MNPTELQLIIEFATDASKLAMAGGLNLANEEQVVEDIAQAYLTLTKSKVPVAVVNALIVAAFNFYEALTTPPTPQAAS